MKEGMPNHSWDYLLVWTIEQSQLMSTATFKSVANCGQGALQERLVDIHAEASHFTS